MAQETQYCSFKYILGTVYSGKTEASEISPAHYISQFLPSMLSTAELLSSKGPWWQRTDRGRLDHVSDCESLDCLVLRRASGAVGASDGLDMAAALLVATAVAKVSLCLVVVSPLAVAYLDALFLTILGDSGRAVSYACSS